MFKKLLSFKFRELAMHGHVGLYINGSVTDELPIKFIVSFDVRLPNFEAFSAHFRRLTFRVFRGGGGGMHPVSPGSLRLRVGLKLSGIG